MLPVKNQDSTSRTDHFNIIGLRDDLKSHAVRSGGVTILSRIATFFIQTISMMVLARILSPNEFGIFAMVTSLCGVLVIFIDLGLTDATIQSTEISHQQVNALFWINMLITGALVLIVMLLAPLVSWVYSEPRLANILRVWSLYLLISALSAQSIALLKRKMRFYAVSVIDISASLSSSLLAIVLAFYGFSYWALVYRQLLSGVFMTAGAWFFCRWYPGRPSFRGNISSILNFGRNATGSFIIGYYARNLDKILLGWRYGADQLGYYHRAYYLFVLPTTQLTEALKNVATSTLSKLRGEPENYRRYYLKALSLTSFVGMPITMFFVIESEDMIILFFGQQWEPTVEIFRILAASSGLWLLYSTKYWLHASLGRADRLIKWVMVDLVVSALAVFVGLIYGPKGVAAAFTCSLIPLTGFGLCYAGRPINIRLKHILYATWKDVFAAIVAGLLCWYMVHSYGTQLPRLIRLMISALLLSALYGISVVLIYRNLQPFEAVLLIVKQFIPGSQKATVKR